MGWLMKVVLGLCGVAICGALVAMDIVLFEILAILDVMVITHH